MHPVLQVINTNLLCFFFSALFSHYLCDLELLELLSFIHLEGSSVSTGKSVFIVLQ